MRGAPGQSTLGGEPGEVEQELRTLALLSQVGGYEHSRPGAEGGGPQGRVWEERESEREGGRAGLAKFSFQGKVC